VLVGTATAYYYLAPSIDVASRLRALVSDGTAGSDGDGILYSTTGLGDLVPGGNAALSTWSELATAGAALTWPEFVVRAVLALVVALALQVGVNYANDYSDGIRGTDDVRVGPVRLVGQKLASPRSVKLAAFACFGIAALCGLALVVITQAWWLLAVGAAAILAAWFYTGGTRPYGYAGLGELFVFVFFGLVAVVGTTYVQILRISWLAVVGGIAVGALSVAILLCNNLRDIPTDEVAGKRTLAVRMGDHGTRIAFSVAIATPFIAVGGMAIGGVPRALLALVSLPLAIRPTRLVRGGATGRDLIPALAGTGLLLLGYAVALSAGIVLSTP
jgi:1,4-dihydroxy-2-naphthoate octaprenyltransferase